MYTFVLFKEDLRNGSFWEYRKIKKKESRRKRESVAQLGEMKAQNGLEMFSFFFFDAAPEIMFERKFVVDPLFYLYKWISARTEYLLKFIPIHHIGFCHIR